MAFKVVTKTRGLKEFVVKLDKTRKTIIDRRTASKLGQETVDGMLRLIVSGFSPIKGPGIRRAFRAYKNPDKYPGNRKPHRPVNLKLSGQFLEDLGFTIESSKTGFAPRVGYQTEESDKKEKGHREGAGGQRRRPTLPTRSGQSLRDSIIDELTEVVQDRLDEVTKKI